MPVGVRVFDAMSKVDRQEWSSVVRAADAPAFYDCRFLDAYEQAPLQPTDAFVYLLLGAPATAVVPAYLQGIEDAAGDITRLPLAGRRPGDRILISHATHCYDSLLPARERSAGLAEKACAELARIGRELGAKWVAFLDVAADGPLAADLTAIGLDRYPMETRYRAGIAGHTGGADFTTRLHSRNRRRKMRANRRRAERLDAWTAVHVPGTADADIAAAVELCRVTTARHGTPDYYGEEFGKFVDQAGDLVRVLEVRVGGRLATSIVSLVDRTRYHMWAGGLDYDVVAEVGSGFALMLDAAVDDAARCGGLRVLEAGRGNGPTKERYELEPVPLVAFTAAC